MNLLEQYLPYLFITFLVLATVFFSFAILEIILEIIRGISYRLVDAVSNIKRMFRKH